MEKVADGIIPAKRKRGQETHDKLVAAAARLLEAETFETLSVADIAKEAGVAVGSFYRRFKTKEAMLPSLYQVYEDDYRRFWAEQLANPDVASPDQDVRIRAYLRHAFKMIDADRGIIRALHVHSRVAPQIVPDSSYPYRETRFDEIAKALYGVAHPSDQQTRIARQVSLVVTATLLETILYPERSPAIFAPMEHDELLEVLEAVVKGILEGQESCGA
ncbi:MAG: TetR/AcrR family transcriptional regulator [Parvularculaceae bacterium]|nr:TetR/AcrR family transcriptional regulator [Parvularculaceae bacterium]